MFRRGECDSASKETRQAGKCKHVTPYSSALPLNYILGSGVHLKSAESLRTLALSTPEYSSQSAAHSGPYVAKTPTQARLSSAHL